MALKPGECLLRRTYIWELIKRGSLEAKILSTGLMVVLKCEPIGIATYTPGDRYPWTTHRRRLSVGSILDPRLISVMTGMTIALFQKLGEVSLPITDFIEYGRGKLIPAYMSVENWPGLLRMQHYILGEKGYGADSPENGEINDLFTLIDQIEILVDLMRNWRNFTDSEKQEIDFQIVRLATQLEYKIDPKKVEAREKLALGISDRLKRINTAVASARERAAQRRINTRIDVITDRIVPVIKLRLDFVQTTVMTLQKRRKSFVTSIQSKIIAINKTRKGEYSINLNSIATALSNLSVEIKATFLMKPWRRRARLCAKTLERAAILLPNALTDEDWKAFDRKMKTALTLLTNMDFQSEIP